MKYYLSFFLLLFISSFSYSQTYLLNEDFETASKDQPPTGWVSNMIAGNSDYDKWYFSDSNYYPSSPIQGNFASIDSYNGGRATPAGTQNNNAGETVALESPAMNTTSLSNLYLSFDYFFFPLQRPTFSVDVSDDDGNNWTQVFSTTATTNNTASRTIDLSSYKGKAKVKVRFKWTNTNTWAYTGWCLVDNVKVFQKNTNDVGVTAIVDPIDFACPNANQPLAVEVTNLGTASASNISVTLKVSGDATGSFTETISSLAAGASTNVFTSQTINTQNGGDVDYEAYTVYTSDTESANDTLTATISTAPKPTTPVGTGATRCGIGSVDLSATAGTTDSTYWFEEASGGQEIATGKNFTTPDVVTTRNYYVENASEVYNSQSTFQGPWRYNGSPTGGSYFDLTAKNDIIIDAVSQHFAYAATGTVIRVWAKKGSYNGSATTQGDWTLITTKTMDTKGFGTFEKIDIPSFRIPAGDTYGFYITAAGASSPTFKFLNLSISNVDLTITGNTVNNVAFQGTLNGYSWDGEVHYRKTCSSPRIAVPVTIIRRPAGVEESQSTPFKGQFKSGIPTDPDITNDVNELTYSFTAPGKYSNATHGTDWTYSVTATTTSGADISSSISTTNPASGTDGTYTFTPPSGYEDSTVNVCLSVLDAATSCDTVICRTVYIAPTPTADFEDSDVCLGEVIQFKNLSTISKGFLSYHWDFGNGDSSELIEPIYTFTKHGKYNVTLTVTSDFGIVSTKTIEIEIYEIPDVKFTVNNACEGVALTFTNSTTISSGTLAFNWKFGDGNTSNAQNPSHTYADAGGYRVELIASANGCSNSLIKNANQFARPTADFDFTGFCTETPISFNNKSTIELGEPIGAFWDFDDNSAFGTDYNPEHIYTVSGTKNVKLKAVSQFGCEDEITKQVVLQESPVANFTVDRLCDKSPTNFTNTSTEPSGTTVYTWNLGDGTTTNDNSPSHSYGEIGMYNVVLNAVSTNGCSSTKTEMLEVLPEPVVDFAVIDGCSGSETVFVNKSSSTSGEISYDWNFGDNSNSTDVAPTHVYNPTEATTYNVTLTATVQGGCTSSKNGSVAIFEKPTCTFTAEQSDEFRNVFTFTPDNATYGADAYTWVFQGEKTSTDVSPVVDFTYTETRYRVLLSITTIAGCECNDSSSFVTTSWGLGVKDAAAPAVDALVYPNPSKNVVNVKVNSASSDEIELFLTDLQGRLIYTETFKVNAAQTYTFNMNDFAVGSYFLKIKQGEKSVTQQLLKD